MIGRTNAGSGGTSLNFTVVSGTTAPSNPKENTIWVSMSTKLTSYVFSATRPENPTNGMVWIKIGLSSPVAFNALKKNGIQIYPISAERYSNGWAAKEAKSYQGGKWVDWIRYLFNAGMEPETAVVGWKSRSDQTARAPTVAVSGDKLVVSYPASSGGCTGVMYFPEKFDLSSADNISLDYTISPAPESSDNGATGLFVWKEISTGYYVESADAYAALSGDSTQAVVDVSALSGEYYVGVGLRGTSASAKTMEIATLKIS